MLSQMKWARTGLVAPVLLALLCGSALAARPPKDPTNLDYSVISETSIELTWESGGGEDGFIVGYLAGVLPQPKCEGIDTEDVGTATSYVVTDLTPGATYGFRVCAYNATKTSDGATLLVTLGGSSTDPLYSLTWLDSFATTHVRAINSDGHVVGLAADPDYYGGEWFAFLYTPENETVDLNTLLPEGSTWRLCRAYDINDQGQIVGRGELAGDPAERAFRYTPAELDENGEVLVPALVEEIGPLYPDDQVNSAYGVNNFGDVCGRVRYDGPTITRIAWYYSDGTGMTPLLDEANMYATTINNATQILGLDEDSGGRLLFRAFPWDTLETAQFIHSPAGEEYVISGNDMNDDGWFVGRTTLEAVQINKNKVRLRVGAYKCDGVNFVDLGAGGLSEAYGINNHGDVVGAYSGNAGPAFVYLEGFGLVNLDDAVTGDPVDLGVWFDGETATYAWRINDNGQIAGRAYIGLLGDYQTFLLTPVPSAN